MRHVSSTIVRAIAATAGAAALVVTLASATHLSPTAAHHDIKLASLSSHAMCIGSREILFRPNGARICAPDGPILNTCNGGRQQIDEVQPAANIPGRAD